MPRQLLRDGAIVADEWRYAAELGPDGGEDVPLILSFEQWQSERGAFAARRGKLGVILAPADPVERLAPDLAHLALVGANFPGIGEGRGYTQARLLRERFGFTRELRATGYVRRDQLFFLARCGFNCFELPESELAVAADYFSTFTATYQPSNDSGLRAALRHR